MRLVLSGPARLHFAALFALLCCALGLTARAQPQPPTEVVVQGSPRHPNAAPKDDGVAASVVGPERIAAPGLGASEVLRGEVGVQIADGGGLGAPATAAIRGATSAQVPVYLGGVRLNDDVSGVADLASVPLWLVERIEVYRGNAPIEADRLGMGGAIFFEPRAPESARSGVGMMAGSFGSRAAWGYATTKSSPSDAGPPSALLVGVRAERADNDYSFTDDGGTHFVGTDDAVRDRENADAELVDVWIVGLARPGSADVRVLANHVERQQGAPKLVLLPSRAARAAFQRTLAAVESRAPIGSGNWVEAQTSAIATTSVLDDPGFELALRTSRLETRGERLAQRLAGRAAIGRLVVRPALDLSAERLRRFDGDRSAAEEPSLVAKRSAVRVASAANATITDDLSLRGLVAGQCATQCAPAARLGLLADFAALSVYANGSRYVREPALGELHGASIVVRGNPRLRSEIGWSADSGARWQVRSLDGADRAWVDVALFARWASELVSFVRSSEGFVQPVNLESARVQGLEFDAGLQHSSRGLARISVTLTDPRDTTPERRLANDVLPFVSRLVVVPVVGASFGAGSGSRTLRRLGAELRYLYQSSRFADAAGLGVIPAQGSLDADFAAELGFGADETAANARLRLANILNEARFDVVGFPLPGRSAFASLEVMW